MMFSPAFSKNLRRMLVYVAVFGMIFGLPKPAEAAECDWSGYIDWTKGWDDVYCSEDVDEQTYTELALLLAACLPSGAAACVPVIAEWAYSKLKEIGYDIAQSALTSAVRTGGTAILENGDEVKAAVHTGTSCEHCLVSGFCYPRANRHRVCVAVGKTSKVSQKPNPPAPTCPGLQSLHEGCTSSPQANSNVCTAALHRYCLGQIGSAVGISQELGPASIGVAWDVVSWLLL